MKVYDPQFWKIKKPIKSWCGKEIEIKAFEQAMHLANLPFLFKHVAIMPDCHMGYGMPIGGVIATDDVVLPSAVGNDIGCGMRALKTNITDLDSNLVKAMMGNIRKVVPVGKGVNHKKAQSSKHIPVVSHKGNVICREENNIGIQIGTLGAGNHFIEIQKGSDGHIWFMIHSGSRHLGYAICKYYDKLARGLNEKWFSKVNPKWELAFLPIGTEECRMYIHEMKYALEWANANRELMMSRVVDVAFSVFPFEILAEYDVHHNYATVENHFGRNVWVHRKGATSAREGQIGIIPGSQKTSSYIVKGKGNRESFMSCSHGSGRTMSRREAREKLNLEEEIKKMDDLGIIHGMRNERDVEEAGAAYKDIKDVMNNQADLVDIVVELKPLGVIKG